MSAFRLGTEPELTTKSWVIDFWIHLTFGSTTDPDGDNWFFRIPHAYAAGVVDAISDSAVICVARTGATRYPGFAIVSNPNLRPMTPDGDRYGATIPITWAAGDMLAISGQLLIVGLD